MGKRLLAVLALAVVLGVPAAVLADDNGLTVDVVIEWLHKGVKDYYIIRKIKEKGATFHLTPAEMNQLHDAGAGAELMQAMLDTAGAPPKETAQPKKEPVVPPPVAPDPPKPPDPNIAKPKDPPKDPVPPKPPDPVPSPPSQPGLVHYRHPWGAFELDYPHGTRVTTIRSGKNALSARHFDVGFVPDGEPDDLDLAEQYFEVQFAKKFWKGEPPTLEACEQRYRDAVMDQGITVSRSHLEPLDGRDALSMYVTSPARGGKPQFKLILYMVLAPEGMYSIAFGATAEKREGVAAAHEQMFHSFRWGKFEEQAVPPGGMCPPDIEQGKPLTVYQEPDGRFRLRYPSPWNVTTKALPNPEDPSAPWVAYYFGRAKYDASSGSPFSFGVSVTVRRTTDKALATAERLTAFADEIAARFTDQAQKRGTLARILGAEWMTFSGLPARRLDYDLVYANDTEEVGYLIVAATPRATYVVEANTPKTEFNRFQALLKQIVEEFEVLTPADASGAQATAAAPAAPQAETPQGDPAATFLKWRDAMAKRDTEVLWELRSRRLKQVMDHNAETARRMVTNAAAADREKIMRDLGITTDQIATLAGKDFFRNQLAKKYPDAVVCAVASLTVKEKEVTQDHATITLLRKDMGTGRVALVFEDGAWRIDTDF